MTTPHRQHRAADRPPTVLPGADGDPGVRQPGSPDVETLVDDVGEGDLPPIAGVRAWCPRPATPQELDDARTVLVVHRLDPRTGRCAACAADCPCPPALDAGRVLAEAGAWNTVPFPGPDGWRTGPGRTGAADGWGTRAVRWVRRLTWAAEK
jgi:hypothetical protein